MRTLIKPGSILAAFAVCLVMVSAAKAIEVEKKIDRFTGVHSVTIKSQPVLSTMWDAVQSGKPYVGMEINASWDEGDRNVRSFLVLSVMSDMTRFLRNDEYNKLSLLVDGKRMSWEKAAGHAAVSVDLAMVSYALTRAQLSQLAKANIVEGKLFAYEFNVPDDLLIAIGNLEDMLP